LFYPGAKNLVKGAYLAIEIVLRNHKIPFPSQEGGGRRDSLTSREYALGARDLRKERLVLEGGGTTGGNLWRSGGRLGVVTKSALKRGGGTQI